MAIKIDGSNMPSDNCYGQNGYTGPSSVPAEKAPLPSAADQTRTVGPNVPDAYGMKKPGV